MNIIKKWKTKMPLIIQGGTSALVLLIALLSALYLFMILAAKKEFYIRRIPGLDAIDEAVGRAAELDRPVHYIQTGGLTPSGFASLNILYYTATLTARMGAKLGVSIRAFQVIPLVEQNVSNAYIEQQIPEQYPANDIRWLASAQFSWTAALIGRMRRERPAANLNPAGLGAETGTIAETGVEIGAMQIYGTSGTFNLPFIIAACDYVLMGDELYAGAAYVSRDPYLLGMLRGMDVAKLFALVTIIIGALLGSLGIDIVEQLLKI